MPPNPPTPATPLTAGALATIKKAEYAYEQTTEGLHCSSRRAGQWTNSIITVGSCMYQIESKNSDGYRKLKASAVKDAVKRIQRAGFTVPNGISFICTDDAAVRCIMYASDGGGNRSYRIYIGPQAVQQNKAQPHTQGAYAGGMGVAGDRGIAHHVYDEKKSFFGNPGRAAMAEAVVVHELGHLLHEDQSPDAFWCEKKGQGIDTKGLVNAATLVSHYANKGPLEFVAEVFTARVYRKPVNATVIPWYTALGGPTVPSFFT
jgi:hypothetical protein